MPASPRTPRVALGAVTYCWPAAPSAGIRAVGVNWDDREKKQESPPTERRVNSSATEGLIETQAADNLAGGRFEPVRQVPAVAASRG